jgi:hypothetical protein
LKLNPMMAWCFADETCRPCSIGNV